MVFCEALCHTEALSEPWWGNCRTFGLVCDRRSGISCPTKVRGVRVVYSVVYSVRYDTVRAKNYITPSGISKLEG
jgi:hypothetical protein